MMRSPLDRNETDFKRLVKVELTGEASQYEREAVYARNSLTIYLYILRSHHPGGE